MNAIWPLAVITYKEGLRNRAFWGIALFALLLLFANLIVSGMILQDVGKVSVDLGLSAFSFSGLLVVLFIGINLLAKDLDKKTIYAVLSRPISRAAYMWGKFIGMVLLLLVTSSLLGTVALVAIRCVKWMYPNYFLHFSWSVVFLAMGFIVVKLVILTAASFFFAALASTSFITLILTCITYLIGQSLGAAKALVENPGKSGVEISPILTGVVNTAYYLFPNLSFFDLGIQAAHGIEVPLSTVIWTIAYGLCYSVLLVTVAALLFQRREFP